MREMEQRDLRVVEIFGVPEGNFKEIRETCVEAIQKALNLELNAKIDEINRHIYGKW